MPKTRSERRFERYLNARGLGFEYEPELGIPFKPDYRVYVRDTEAICEVKEFATSWLLRRLSPIGSASMEDVTRAVRKRVRRAAEQLADLAPRALPLVVVLSNPQQADVDLDRQIVWAGLYDDASPLARNRADHISAVAILERRTAAQDWATENVRRHKNPLDALLAALRADGEGAVPTGERLFVTVLPTVSATAVPLPPTLFRGTRRHNVAAAGRRRAAVAAATLARPAALRRHLRARRDPNQGGRSARNTGACEARASSVADLGAP